MVTILIDLVKNNNVEFELILCKPFCDKIAILDSAFDINYESRFPTTDELSFNIPYYIINNNKRVENYCWDLIKSDYLILFNKIVDNSIIEQKYFIINNIKDIGGEKENKQISCMSLEYELNKKQIRSYKMISRKLYSVNNEFDSEGQVGVMNYITTLTSWILDTQTFNNVDTIFIDSKGSPLYRSFDVSEQTVFDFLINTVQKSFGCIFLFDTINKKISVYKINDIGTNKGLYISESNYIKSINQELKIDEIVTRLYCYGKDNLSINGINPAGVSYIEDFSYYKNDNYMPQDLINALNDYEAKLNDYPEMTESDNSLISLGGNLYKIICNSSKANAFKKIKEVRILSDPEYVVPLDRCVFNNSSPSYIGDENGKINITLDNTILINRNLYTYEVKKVQTANEDMSVVLNNTNLIITLGTDEYGNLDDSKNLTMYISGAINNISGFKSIVEINGKLYKSEPQDNFNLNEIIIDGTDLPITYPSDSKIIYSFDTFLNLRNELLVLLDEKRSYQNELSTLMIGYYELGEYDSSILIVDGLYQIQDKIDLAIKNNESLTALNNKLKAKEIEVCDKQLQIDHVIEDIEIKDIFNKHNIYTKIIEDGNYIVTHKNGTPLSPSVEDLIDVKQDEIEDFRDSISKENNFTSDQLIKLDSFIKEKTWSDSSYENEEDLYNEGIVKLSSMSTPLLSFSIDVVDFLQIVEGKIDKTKLILGDLVTIGFDKFDLDIVVRLIGFSYEIDNYNLKLNFSNKDKYDDPLIYLAELQKNTITTSTTINMDKYKWDKSEDNTSAIYNIVNNALDASKNQVLAGKNQDIKVDRSGVHLFAKDDNDVVLPEQIRMISNLIVFTKDNWQTASTAISPYGVNAESLYSKLIVSALGSFEGIEVYQSDDGISKRAIDIGKYTEKDESGNESDKYGIAINSYSGVEYKNRILFNAIDGMKIQKYSSGVPINKFYTDIDGNLCVKGNLTGSTGIFSDKIILGTSDTNYKLKFDGTNLVFSDDVKIQFKGDQGAQGPQGPTGSPGSPGSYYAPSWVKSTYIDFNSIQSPSMSANQLSVGAGSRAVIIQGSNSNNSIRSCIKAGKTDYGNGVGFWLGDHSDIWKFDIGNNVNYIRWDGSNLNIAGQITLETLEGIETGINISGSKISGQTSSATRVYYELGTASTTLEDSRGGVLRCSTYIDGDNIRDCYLDITHNAILAYQKVFAICGQNKILLTDGTLTKGFLSWSLGSSVNIKGNCSIGSDYYTSSSPANGLIVQGNVGIGKTTVASGYKLDVYGNIKCTTLSTTNYGTNDPSGGSDGDLYFQYI